MVICKRDRFLKPGFSFAEIIVVVMIMGILGAIIVPKTMEWIKDARKNTAVTQMQLLSSAIEKYQMDTGYWPETLEDLIRMPFDERVSKNWDKSGYLQKAKIPVDPWRIEYKYRLTPGERNPFALFSYGPNREAAPEEEWIYA